MTKRSKTGFTVVKQVSEEPMTEEQWEACESLLAKLVARAIMAEYRESAEVKGND